jgi:hypothetical protein
MDESNDPNNKGFAIVGHYAEGDNIELIAPATGEDNFSGGFAIAGESYPDLHHTNPYNFTDYINNVIASRWNNPSGSTEIRHVNIPRPEMVFIPPNPAFGYLEIVRAVAETDSTYEYAGRYYCPYCEATQVRSDRLIGNVSDEELSKLFPHDADCIVLKARAMLATMPHVEVKNDQQ